MLKDLLFRLRSLFRSHAAEGELDEELRFHLEKQAELYVNAGVAPDEARRRAAVEFGGFAQTKEHCREAWGIALVSTIWQDVKYGVRMLARTPAFTAVAVASLALGIGANTAIFSILDQALVRNLPVKDPERLVVFRSPGVNPGMDRNSGWKMSFSYPKFVDFRDRSGVFDGVFARFATPGSLTYERQSERVNVELVSGSYFNVLGVSAAAGRLIGEGDDITPMAHPVAVLSYDYWMRRFGGDASIVGRKIILSDAAMTVVGVSARGFKGVERGESYDVRVPMMMKDAFTPQWRGLDERFWAWLNIFARLKPGMTHQQATAAANVFYGQVLSDEARQLRGPWAAQRDEFVKRRLELLPAGRGNTVRLQGFREEMTVLMAMAGLVVLIACVNIASLLMARTAARQREMAVRLALGAGRGRITRQLMIESLLLAGAGGVFGLLLATVAAKPILTLIWSEDALRIISTAPDARVLAFTMGVTLLTALLFGIAPALQPARAGLMRTLKTETNVSAGRGQVCFRKVLVSVQVALCVWLAVAAGLFARTLANLRHVDLGFRTENLLRFGIDPTLTGYSNEEGLRRCFRIRDRAAALPGVVSASFSSYGILGGGINIMRYDIPGFEDAPPDEKMVFELGVSPEYFESLGQRLMAGRSFVRSDADAVRTVIVNQAFARKYFKRSSPVGRRIRWSFDRKSEFEVVGVVHDEKYMDMRAEPGPFVYRPVPYTGAVTFYVRAQRNPEALLAAISREVQAEAPGVPLYDVTTMQKHVDNALRQERMVAALSAAFGVLATLLAAIGLYGVMAYVVTRRTREIGIRVALGARRTRVLSMVMSEAGVVVAAGLCIGVPGALMLSRFVQSQLYGVKANDPATIFAAGLLVTAVAGAAGVLPARRASRIDPVRALRYE